MNLADFEGAPTKLRHPVYDDSMLFPGAPEWSTGEVLLASAYRRLILGAAESEVDLSNIEQVPSRMQPGVGGAELWSRLLTQRGGLTSPLKHGQYSALSARQLMPLVPAISRIAGVLGKRARSRWNPSNLLLQAIGSGLGRADGEALVRKLGESLAISPDDDLFARFVESSLSIGLQGIPPAVQQPAPFLTLALGDADLRGFRHGVGGSVSPAERFCRDLPLVLETKKKLTRRQWTVLVESILRIGLGMHVLWTCNANVIMWDLSRAVASGNPVPSDADVERTVWDVRGESRALLELGSDAEQLIERLLERYAYARTGINLLLCKLDDAGVPWTDSFLGFGPASSNSAPVVLSAFLNHISVNRGAIHPGDAGAWLSEHLGQLFDEREDLRELAKCEYGYTKNLFEFARHTLGQVMAKYAEQRTYDLAYLLAYVSERKPLSLEPGAAMLVTLVHACCSENPSIPSSLEDFRQLLGDYGLHVPAGELVDGKTGRDLARLGLVVDSPDAAGGRLLVPPF